MKTRRQALRNIVNISAGVAAFLSCIGSGVRIAWAETVRRLLPKGTPMSELMHKNPVKLDTRNLDTTPLDEFDVMGQTIHPMDLKVWRLELGGAVAKPQSYTYEQLIRRPAVERNVLLVCRGFFAYNGHWKGVSSAALLSEVGVEADATHVEFSGPSGIGKKKRRYELQEVLEEKVFLAYGVNGKPLPERHGFPLRLVAEDHYGSRWVKYVDKVTVLAR